MKKDTITIYKTLSITRRRAGLDVLGVIIGVPGMILIFANIQTVSSVADEQIRTETLILGTSLTLLGTAMIYRKSYSQRKWQYHITN